MKIRIWPDETTQDMEDGEEPYSFKSDDYVEYESEREEIPTYNEAMELWHK